MTTITNERRSGSALVVGIAFLVLMFISVAALTLPLIH